jgi:DNA-binding NarL/FixJ family response regulator
MPMVSSDKEQPPIRVLIADDEAINRLGLRYLIANCPGLEVVAEAANGKEALQHAAICHPDIVLLDITMPEMDGIMAARAIRKLSSEIKILMLTSLNGPKELGEALAAGANGYCLKDSKPEQLLKALSVIGDGNTFLDSKAMPHLVNAMAPKAIEKPVHLEKTQAYEPLSETELEILSMKMSGLNDVKTAETLNVSLETLRKIEETIKEKILDLENRDVYEHKSKKIVGATLVCEECEGTFAQSLEYCPIDGTPLVEDLVTRKIGTFLGGKW